MDPKRLAGKNIVVTGAAQGMGAANAMYFAAQGANVVLGDLNVKGAQAVADNINQAGVGKAVAVSMNVTKREDHAAAVKACVDAFGSINVYLNNAGVNKPKMFLDIDDENWDLIMNVNTKGVLYGMQEATKQMIKQTKVFDCALCTELRGWNSKLSLFHLCQKEYSRQNGCLIKQLMKQLVRILKLS